MRRPSSGPLFLLLLIAACSHSEGATAPPAARGPGANSTSAKSEPSTAGEVREVRTAVAREEGWERTLGATGELTAFEEAVLSTKVPGRVVEIAVDVGTRVARGDVVASIDAKDYELRVQQAEAAVAAARAVLGLPREGDDDQVDPESTSSVKAAISELDEARRRATRAESLVRGEVGSQAELDSAQTNVRSAEGRLANAREDVETRRAQLAQRRADLALARQLLADTKIVAPFDGAAVARLVGTGDYLTAGTGVARIVRTDPLRLRLRIPERDAASVRVGQMARVEVEGDERVHEAALVRISPALSSQSRTLLVEGELANPDATLRAGSFARARIVIDAAAQALTVPVEAMSVFAGIEKVFVVTDAKVEERRVHTGRRDERRVEILEGLKVGEEVVLAPGNLQGGASVRAAR